MFTNFLSSHCLFGFALILPSFLNSSLLIPDKWSRDSLEICHMTSVATTLMNDKGVFCSLMNADTPYGTIDEDITTIGFQGVKLLVQLAEGDLPVLDFLNDYIQEFLDSSYHGNTEFYLRSHQFVSQLEQFYRQKNSQCPYYLISFFRHIITLISETLFLSATSDVCKIAIESVVVTSPKVKVKSRDLIANVESIQDLTIKLEIDIIRHLKGKRNFLLNQFDSKSVITQTEQIWRLLRRCETPLKEVTMAITQKASADRNFFQTASLGIGAVCAGRFLWSLWKGEGHDQLVNAALWSAGTGMSGAVLQIPRARAARILEELQRQKDKKQDLQEILKHWLIESDGICAKLVLYSSSSGSKY